MIIDAFEASRLRTYARTYGLSSLCMLTSFSLRQDTMHDVFLDNCDSIIN